MVGDLYAGHCLRHDPGQQHLRQRRAGHRPSATTARQPVPAGSPGSGPNGLHGRPGDRLRRVRWLARRGYGRSNRRLAERLLFIRLQDPSFSPAPPGGPPEVPGRVLHRLAHRRHKSSGSERLLLRSTPSVLARPPSGSLVTATATDIGSDDPALIRRHLRGLPWPVLRLRGDGPGRRRRAEYVRRDRPGRERPATRRNFWARSSSPATTRAASLPADYTFTEADAGVHTFHNVRPSRPAPRR